MCFTHFGPFKTPAHRILEKATKPKQEMLASPEGGMENLMDANRLRTIASLSAGLAHDFNNILASIMRRVEVARRRPTEGDPVREDLDAIMATARHGSDLARHVQNLSRARIVTNKPIGIGTAVKEALELVRIAVDSSIDIHCIVDQSTPLVAIDRSELHQVVMNLGMNACSAMTRGRGRLFVLVDGVVLSNAHAALCGGSSGGQYVRILIGDNGCGMPEAVRRQAFEPFFTTKESDSGTGLGLPLVRSIANRYGGFVTLCSEVDHGTDVTVFLPASTEA